MANGGVTPLEVEGNRWIPSMVLLDPEGNLVVGAAADHQAGVYPDRVERTPKRYLGRGTPLLLGDEAVEVRVAVARLMALFVDEGRLRRGGRLPAATVLTHPVRWGDDRKDELRSAGVLLGLDDAVLLEEPVAAAAHYVGDQVAVGRYVGVYDLGGGTFDTAILQRTDTGFEVVGTPGGDEHIGGEHLDHLVYDYLGSCIADDDPDLWEQIELGEERRWTRAAADLLTQARRAKETVSSYPSTQALLPLVDRDVVFTRARLEEMIGGLIDQTVDEMESTIVGAGLRPDQLEAIYLVGGSSRIPLVAARMAERFGDRIATRDEPKSVVALGAALVGRNRRGAVLGPGGRAEPLVEAWRAPLHHAVRSVGVGRAGTLVVADAADTLHGFGDGRWRWSVRLPSAVVGRPATVGSTVVVVGAEGQVSGFDASDGRVRFGLTLAAPATGVTGVDPELAILADAAGTVTAVGSADGQVHWVLPLGAGVRAPLAVTGGAVLVACTDGRVYRAASATGRVAWAFPAPTPVIAAPAVAGAMAFIACADGAVYAIDVRTGRPHWGSRVSGPVDGAPVVVGDQLVVADRTGRVTGLATVDGVERWHVDTGGPHRSGLVAGGSSVASMSGDGRLVVVDPARAAVAGAVTVTAPLAQPPSPLADTFVVADGAELRAFRAPGARR